MPKQNILAWIIILAGVFLIIGDKSGVGLPIGWFGLALIGFGIFMRMKKT